jgi:uncharacterized protein (DUF2235 family)
MKNVAIFCDGTWNSADAVEVTNVALAFRAAVEVTAEGVPQARTYFPGIGTPTKKAGWIETQVDKYTGGAFGWGMDARLQAAYRKIAERYQPGDRLFLFGFSRGAYMARSLAGMIRNCGLPTPETAERIPEAMEMYRSRAPGSHPDAPGPLKFRAEFSPHFATSETDRLVRRGDVAMVAVDYLGVWDTVGALGVPAQFRGLSAMFNQKYRFHDLRLSSMVKSARHAVAIDERRTTFPPTLWENLSDLNLRDGGGDSPYRQEWFPGTHGGVGGGGPIRGLSHAALLWVLEGAMAAGMGFDAAKLADFAAGVDLAAPVDNQTAKPGVLTQLFRGKGADRDPPPSLSAISGVAREKWRLHGYRPVPLRPFGPRLVPPVMPGEW